MVATSSPLGSSSSQVRPVEIGSLSTSSPNESQFFGSSSGVFFVNTVFRAFAESRQGPSLLNNAADDTESPSQAPVDNCIADQSDDGDTPFAPVSDLSDFSIGISKTYGIAECGLGRPPTLEVAKRLVMSYFEVWHPVFPFLHGPTFLREVESFYGEARNPPNTTLSDVRDKTRRAVILQCVFNIAATDTADIISPIKSASSLMSLLGMLSTKHDTPSLQALLAAQLYFIASMSLQAASTVGGMLWRNIFHAGLHRCPFRYVQLSQHDCDIRKRIFWCTYATDRYLSQALGHPLGIQDSDIDVCVPGTKELHKPVTRSMHSRTLQNSEKDILLHLPDGHPDLEQNTPNQAAASRSATPVQSNASAEPASEAPQGLYHQTQYQLRPTGEDVLASYVGYSRITGQVLELFHKSIHNRSVDNSNILNLSAEVHTWWNSLPNRLQDMTFETQSKAAYSFGSFFTILYQQLLLLLNRPFLSLNPTSPTFRSSLQTCIGASRTIISTLKDHSKSRQCLSAPGILSSTWMAGLVIAFACELNAYPFHKGCSEMETCLGLLHIMGSKWNSASHCHKVLGMLLANLKARSKKESVVLQTLSTDYQPLSRGSARKTPRPHTTIEDRDNDKRQRLSSQNFTTNANWCGVDRHQEQAWLDSTHMGPDIDDTLGDNTMMGIDMTGELEWPDVFEQVSWEALFHGDGNSTADMSNTWH